MANVLGVIGSARSAASGGGGVLAELRTLGIADMALLTGDREPRPRASADALA